MKKIATILFCAAAVAMVSCGPSEEEKKAAHDKKIKDSLDSLRRDSITKDSMINNMLGPMLDDTTGKKDSANKTPEKK